jgi:hypothetical protein
VRKIFCEDPFWKSLKCFQEVPVKALVPGYQPNHFVDWYIDELGTILELHGAQHYQIANFGGASYESAQSNFHDIRYRDNLKKTALVGAGFEYREIGYKLAKKLNSGVLRKILLNGD